MTQYENCDRGKLLVSGINLNGYRLLLASALIWGSAQAQNQVLDTKMHNLRMGSTREWADFPVNVNDSQLVIYFDVKDTVSSGSIELRQFEVKQIWEVRLNQTKLGQLTVDEKDMRTYLPVPKDVLKKKSNKLVIRSRSARPDVSDDIKVGRIFLHYRSVKEMLSETSLTVNVNDAETGSPLPSRITITDTYRSLQPVNAVNDSLAVRTGVIYTGTGAATFQLPAGGYTIYASRGFEYGVDSVTITSKPGDNIHKTLSIRHEVDTQGWIGCDPHIHSLTYSGHGDATLRERILTIAGEGIGLPVITEHNAAIDISDTVRAMGMNAWFTPVTGNEVTTKLGHFNLFPVTPTGKTNIDQVGDWNELTRNIRATPSVKVVVLNHAQDIHNGFRPFDLKHHIGIAGKSGLDWSFPANAMEVINSGSQQTDPRELYKNWMGMLNRGIMLTPVGSSDAHEVSRFLVGQARTYIRDSKQDNGIIDAGQVISNFAAGNVTVSFGLFTEIVVDSLYGPGDLVPASGA
ncbi:MAG TPA: CehA/McbA family metallohydrolase, partial [Flavitalea sp.]|nr:CehA/McbA family metallohydrolase [Flavitalea sp.]